MLEQKLTKNRWLLPVLLVLGCCLFYSNVWPFNRDKGILQGHDLARYTYPYFDFIAHEVHQNHELPLWNPHELSGFSIIGAGEVNVFYPPNWLIFIIETKKAVALNLILHGFIGMWGIAVLARQLGSSRLGALLTGLLWGGSGLMGARLWAGHYTILLPIAWTPWVLAGFVWSVRKGTWTSGVRGAVPMGLLYLSGHPQIAFITGVIVAVIWGFEIFDEPSRQRFWTATRPLITLTVLSFLLAAIALLPVIGTALASGRNAEDQDRIAFADKFSVPANQLLTFAFPYMIGGNGIPGDRNVEELFAYIGLLPLLALMVLLTRPTREVWLLVIISGLGLVLSLAMDGGLLRLLVQVLPPAGMFRSAGRWLILPQMALACMGGLFITYLQNTDLAERQSRLNRLLRLLPRFFMGCFGLAFIMSWGRVLHTDAIDGERLWYSAQTVAKTALFLLFFYLILLALRTSEKHFQQLLLLLVFVAVLDVWASSLPFIKVSSADPYNPKWSLVEQTVPASSAGLQRIIISRSNFRTYTEATGKGYYDVDGYEQLAADSYNKWLDKSNLLSPTNLLLGVGYLVRGEAYPDELLDPETGMLDLLATEPEQNLYVYAVRHPVQRAFLASGVVVEKDEAAMRDYYINNPDADMNVVHVDQPASCLHAKLAGGDVEIVAYHPNQVRLKVNSEGPGVLFLSDRYAQGWQVTVNGEKSDIFRADTVFRAVCVPDRESEVVFSYRPLSLYIGGVISGISWLGVACVFLVKSRRALKSLHR